MPWLYGACVYSATIGSSRSLMAPSCLRVCTAPMQSCVGKGNKAAKKLPALVLPLAAAKLAKAFGLELRELRRHTPGGPNRSCRTSVRPAVFDYYQKVYQH